MADKKSMGIAVKGILETATEHYNVMGEDALQDVVSLINSAYMICTMWELKEITLLHTYVNRMNCTLNYDASVYRIILDDLCFYRIVKII